MADSCASLCCIKCYPWPDGEGRHPKHMAVPFRLGVATGGVLRVAGIEKATDDIENAETDAKRHTFDHGVAVLLNRRLVEGR